MMKKKEKQNYHQHDDDDDDELSIASDDISVAISLPKLEEEATLSWRNDPYYKYVEYCINVGRNKCIINRIEWMVVL